MIQSLAIQGYFAQMRHFFSRQGFDVSTKVIYGADAKGNLDLLDQDLANKDMDRKGTTTRESVRSNPYTYLFWTKGTMENIVRRSARLRDGVDEQGSAHYKKVVSIKFPLVLAFISNKGNTIEDFEEAFAAEWQNLHNAQYSMKWAYPRESDTTQDDLWMNATIIQELGSSELVSYREGNLFAYSWTATLHLTFVSEFAEAILHRLKHVMVDLYTKQGIPLASIGDINTPTHEVGEVPDTGTGEAGPGFVRIPEHTPQDPPPVADYTAIDGTVVPDVPVIPHTRFDF